MATRIAVLTCIHANLPALEAVLRDADQHSPDLIIHGGDLVGHGPYPNEVIDLIRERGLDGVMGNYDEAVGYDLPECGCVSDTQEGRALIKEALRWSQTNVDDAHKAMLRDIPEELRLEIEGHRVHVMHATPYSHSHSVYCKDVEVLEDLADNLDADICLCGHTHLAYDQMARGTRFVNGGSVGRPRDGNTRAGYTLLTLSPTKVEVEHLRIDYDVDATLRTMGDRNVPHGLIGKHARGRY